jgi:ArsR family transcriptional regulator, zinc-responsive transcriptional repressor
MPVMRRKRKENQVAVTNQARAISLNDHLGNIAHVAKSLSDENRLRILLCVSTEKKSVNRVAEEVGLSQALVSHHLRELKRSLLVRVERSGPFVYYEIADVRVLRILDDLNVLATDLLATRTAF